MEHEISKSTGKVGVYLILFVFFFIIGLASNGFGQTTKVLFLGNSFTYTYDIPTLFEGLANDAGYSVLVDEYTTAGIAVYDDAVPGHINNASSQSKITSQQWDYVVVQDNMGGWVYDFIASGPGNANVTLYNQIKANNECTRIVYFSAWGPEGGVPGLGYPGESTQACNNRIHTNLVNFNDQASEEIVSPVGKSWNQSLSALPGVDLFYSDNVHPSLEGSYLAALTIFTSIFKSDPALLAYNGGVSSSTANTMKGIAWDIVMSPTMFNECNLDMFTPVITNVGGQLSSTGFTSYQWYFNGVLISGATTSTYNTSQNGTYTLNGYDAYGCESSSSETTVTGLGLNEDNSNLFSVYPNPAINQLNINSRNKLNQVLIHNITGELVYQSNIISQSKLQIDLSEWSRGVYIMTMIDDLGLKHIQKVVVK